MDLAAVVDAGCRNDEYVSWGYHSRVSTSHRYVCMTVPKVACTTIKSVLCRLDGAALPEDMGEIHSQATSLADFVTSEIVTMLTSPDWLRFAFVRNPYARLLSAYKSKIGNTWEQQYRWLQDEIRAACSYPSQEGVVAFHDYVRYVAASTEPRITNDGHITAQTNILMPGLISYDIIGRFETLQADFAQILRRLGAPAEVIAETEVVRNPTPAVSLATVYDEEIADLAFELYGADFEAYGYERDSWRSA